MSKCISVAEANGHLAELIELAQRGEEIVIEDAANNRIKLVTLPRAGKERILGLHEGLVAMRDDFNAPLPKDFWLGTAP